MREAGWHTSGGGDRHQEAKHDGEPDGGAVAGQPPGARNGEETTGDAERLHEIAKERAHVETHVASLPPGDQRERAIVGPRDHRHEALETRSPHCRRIGGRCDREVQIRQQADDEEDQSDRECLAEASEPTRHPPLSLEARRRRGRRRAREPATRSSVGYRPPGPTSAGTPTTAIGVLSSRYQAVGEQEKQHREEVVQPKPLPRARTTRTRSQMQGRARSIPATTAVRGDGSVVPGRIGASLAMRIVTRTMSDTDRIEDGGHEVTRYAGVATGINMNRWPMMAKEEIHGGCATQDVLTAVIKSPLSPGGSVGLRVQT